MLQINMHFIIICNNIYLNPISIYSVYIQYIGMFPFSQEHFWEPLVRKKIMVYFALQERFGRHKNVYFLCGIMSGMMGMDDPPYYFTVLIPVAIGAPPTTPCAKNFNLVLFSVSWNVHQDNQNQKKI